MGAAFKNFILPEAHAFFGGTHIFLPSTLKYVHEAVEQEPQPDALTAYIFTRSKSYDDVELRCTSVNFGVDNPPQFKMLVDRVRAATPTFLSKRSFAETVVKLQGELHSPNQTGEIKSSSVLVTSLLTLFFLGHDAGWVNSNTMAFFGDERGRMGIRDVTSTSPDYATITAPMLDTMFGTERHARRFS